MSGKRVVTERTSTRSFGVSRREGHDSSAFYERFGSPKLSNDAAVVPCPVRNELRVGDSRDLSFIPDNSISLMVTSPPYFAGKEYETALGEEGVPASYVEFLAMLRDVFAETHRVLEPGGRMAINVANLGRKPYRSLSADIIHILQDDLGMLLRGEIVWVKARGAAGNCAWGSFAKATNPTLRDVTERIVVASKGRFDRALKADERKKLGLGWESTIDKDDFMAWTLDTWNIAPESAKRAGHPAPFPVELPRRFIELYTFANDNPVLDVFCGSGTTAVAAALTGRPYIGIDTDSGYIDIAHKRVSQAAFAQTEAAAVVEDDIAQTEPLNVP